jgi:hypothetical protein
MSRFTGRRKFVVLATALIALAFGVSVGLAKSGPSQWKVPMYWHNQNCGGDTTKKVVAIAYVQRTKGTVKVRGKVHGGTPGKYRLQIWDPNGCVLLGSIDDFKVDSGGDGNFAGSTSFSSPQTIIVSIWNKDLDFYNDSLPFWLGSS